MKKKTALQLQGGLFFHAKLLDFFTAGGSEEVGIGFGWIGDGAGIAWAKVIHFSLKIGG